MEEGKDNKNTEIQQEEKKEEIQADEKVEKIVDGEVKKSKNKKKKKEAEKPFTYDFKEEIENLNREPLKTRLNVPQEYQIPEHFRQKPKPEFLVGNIHRIDTVLAGPEKYFDKCGFVAGWSKAQREQGGGKMIFMEINDGSRLKGLQVVIDNSEEKIANFEQIRVCQKDSSFKIYGKFLKSQGKGQAIEMIVNDSIHKVEILGVQNDVKYPFPPEKRDLLHISKENMREHAHLRPRTRFIGCVARVRNNLSLATHKFFQALSFQYIHTPLITASDCEGAGEMFQVTTLLTEKGKIQPIEKVPIDKETKNFDYKQDFFKKPAFLTVSGQLAVENYACALSNVYTFGPTFRAETSKSTRHLAEFWMIEPELSFADLADNMDCAEAYIKFCLQYLLDNNEEDLDFLGEYQQKEFEKNEKDLAKLNKGKKKTVEKAPPVMLKEYLTQCIAKPFERITYDDAIKILQRAEKEGKVFEEEEAQNPTWDEGLATEHEKFLAEYVFKRPVMVYNYPAKQKAFYMRLNDDKKTVAAVDVLFPGVGELVGGAQREERLSVLEERLEELQLDRQDYWWYLQLREYGSVPHAGFGLGFERLVMMSTGATNIKDVIPFPRQTGVCEF